VTFSVQHLLAGVLFGEALTNATAMVALSGFASLGASWQSRAAVADWLMQMPLPLLMQLLC
jgi:hypothetical protein